VARRIRTWSRRRSQGPIRRADRQRHDHARKTTFTFKTIA
jgi:hypothetical protein